MSKINHTKRTQFQVRIDRDMLLRVDRIAAAFGVGRSEIARLAIGEFVLRMERRADSKRVEG